MELKFFSTRGLIKKINEDQIRRRVLKNRIVVVLCDGHWGKSAAVFVSNQIVVNFPQNQNQAQNLLRSLQQKLFESCQKTDPDPELDKPSETSMIAIQFDKKSKELIILSYGDCRGLISKKGEIINKIPTNKTWLGAFSHLGLRNRLSIESGLIFQKTNLKKNDRLWLFTDGVDECIYEKLTIPHTWIVKHTKNQILARILKHGAEDNASLVILKC